MEKDEEIITLLKGILKWTRFSALENVRNEIRRTLDTDQKRLIYSLSDGKTNSRDVAKQSGVSDFTVRKYWSEWISRGLAEPINVRGGKRSMKSFNLADFGLIIPDIPEEEI